MRLLCALALLFVFTQAASAQYRLTPDMNEITKPGVYVVHEDQFRRNIGLTISVDNVFINLNGRYLGSWGPQPGISAVGRSGITIANGTVWSHPGYYRNHYNIRITGGVNNTVKNVIATGAQAISIWLDGGSGGVIQNCSVHSIGKSITFERAFAYTLYGTGHTLKNSYAWYVYGRIESGAVGAAGDGNKVLNNPTFNGGSSTGTWYGVWFSSGHNVELKGNRFVGGYNGATLSGGDGSGIAGNNRFEGVEHPYFGAWTNIGGDVVTP